MQEAPANHLYDDIAESTVLGVALTDPARAYAITHELTENHFTSKPNKAIFAAVRDILSKSFEPNIVNVGNRLKEKEMLVECGGMAALTDLAFVQSRDCSYETNRLRHLLGARKQLKKMSEVSAQLMANPELLPDLLDEVVETSFKTKFATESQHTSEPFLDVVKRRMAALQDRIDGGGPDGIATGFKGIDDYLRLCPGDFVIFGARPSMGKTAFSLNLGYNLALEGKKILVFSMEMTRDKLVDRLFAYAGDVPAGMIRDGQIGPRGIQNLEEAVAMWEKNPPCLEIVDAYQTDVTSVAAKAQEFKQRNKGLDLIIFDYLQLLVVGDNRYEKVCAISRGFKEMAHHLDVPVWCLSQLSRECEKRPNKRPILADLRESGSLEQDCDVAIFLYRDEVYNDETELRGEAELLIRKNRNGRIGESKLIYRAERLSFEDKPEIKRQRDF